MSPGQLWDARILLCWSRDKLAEVTEIPVEAVIDLERADRPINDFYQSALRVVLEAAGVEFTNGAAPGARLRRTGSQ